MKCILIIAMLFSTALNARSVTFEVERVYDGDTIKGSINTLPHSLSRISIRIRSIDAPGIGRYAKCEEERKLGEKATEFLSTLIKKGQKIEIFDEKPYDNSNYAKWDKYGGRILYDFRVEYEGKKYFLSHLMVLKGFARPYDGGKKWGWCND